MARIKLDNSTLEGQVDICRRILCGIERIYSNEKGISYHSVNDTWLSELKNDSTEFWIEQKEPQTKTTVKEMFEAGVMAGGVVSAGGDVYQVECNADCGLIWKVTQEDETLQLYELIDEYNLVAWYDRHGNRNEFRR